MGGVIGEADKLAICAWAPAGLGGGYIAAGTYSGTADASFASDASLELLSVDIQNSKLAVTTECKTPERFSSIAWSYPSRAHPAGLIAGGLFDGTVRVWDAATLIRGPRGGEDADRGVVAGGSEFAKKHEASVRGVCFNPFSPHMLASGGADSKLNIWDLSNLTQGPNVYPPDPESINPSPSEEVFAIQWNLRVSHILGSGTAGGVVRIWDLKKRKQALRFSSSGSRMRCSGIHWHPEIATQVLTTCNQDNGFGALLWDLRSLREPIVTFNQFAQRGVTSASWCSQDSEMILISTTEPRNLIVSSKTGELLCDLQAQPSASFDVQWSPRIPGLYLTSSVDSNLTVKSLLTSEVSRSVSVETANALAESFGEMATGFETGAPVQSPKAQSNEKKAVSIQRPPKWLRRPVSVSFGYSGRYAVLSSKSNNVTVSSHQMNVQGMREIVADLDSILGNVAGVDIPAVEALCRESAKNSDLKEDMMGFEILSLLFQENSRAKILKYLGYEVANGIQGTGAETRYGLPLSSALATPERTESEGLDVAANGGPDVGNNLHTNALDQMPSVTGPAPWDQEIDDQSGSILDGTDAPLASGNGLSKKTIESDSQGFSGNEFEGLSASALDSIVRNCVVTGNLEKAVDACLFAGRIADALVLARAGGPALWYRAQSEYLTTLDSRSSGNIISAIAGPQLKLGEFLNSVNSQSKEAWKEALAVILTYVRGDSLAESCTTLGERLLHDRRDGPALVCFMCAGNTKMAIATWRGEIPAVEGSTDALSARVKVLGSLVRKVRLLTSAVLLGMGDQDFGSVRCLDELSGSILCEFSGLLALTGEMDLASSYVSNLDPEVSGPYGTASDILHRASSEFTTAPASAPVNYGQTHSSTGYSSMGYGYYGGSYYEQVHAPTASDWNNTSVPSPMNGSVSTHSQVPPPAPAPVAPPPAPANVQPSHATRSQTAGGMFDPAVYSNNMNFSTPAYSVPAPAVPTAPPVPVSAPPVSVPAPPLPGSVAPPMPQAPSFSGPTSMVPTPQSTLSPNFSSPANTTAPPLHGMQPMQQFNSSMPSAPPPPPPPSTDAPMPTSYHANAKSGLGQTLPPSAEVAVFEERKNKAMSQSAVPGSMPRRSQSTSSNLSSASNEAAPVLDKADVNSVPSEHQIIVKSLRGAYSYAVTRNNSMMYRKKMEDVNKKLGRLVSALGKGTADPNVIPHLLELARFIEKGKYDSASTVVSTLTQKHWDGNGTWVQALKRLVDSVLSAR